MFKVLVVEDEEPIRKGIIYTFEWEKNDCIVIAEASNGLDGVEKIIELKPDIVITDIGMPVLNGLEMLEEVMDEYIFSSIIISVYDEFNMAKQALNIGVSNYLLKPLNHQELEQALERAKKDLIHRKSYQKELMEEKKDLSDLLNINLSDNQYKNIYVIKIKAYLEKNYKKRIGLQDIVEELNVSSTYINRNLKEETNQTFNEFLNRFRIQKAIELMKKEDLKIYHIAEEVGYKDYKYFISVFKKYVGVSPSKLLAFYKNTLKEQK